MLAPVVHLALALCATVHVARAAVEASNSSMGTDPFNYAGHLWLRDADGANITELIPLSVQATTTNLDGTLYLTTDRTVANISDNDIAFISCDPYPGNLQALDVFQTAYNSSEINGAIFYSTTSLYCVYNGITEMMQNFPIYSMNSTTDSASTVRRLSDPASSRISVSIVRSVVTGGDGGPLNGTKNNPNPNPNQNPLGPSPSTAVAMIILYSITGIITALFLVIIVTGAIRAHRHPDRYGPRDVLGRPRQSRARGLGRAILDTLPIVKFGQTEPPKPTDVELGSASEVRDANATGAEPNAQNAQTTAQPNGAPNAETPLDAPAGQHETMASGISEAQPVAAGAAAAQSDNADDSLVCSICTEEFEQGQDIRVLPCNHKFHPDCVDPWLLNVSGTCPLCRVDLRPVTTNDSSDSNSNSPDHLAPPLQSSSNDLSSRRRTLMRDILSFRTRPDASADERISALRRLREQRRNRSEEGVNASDENVAAQRRSRMSLRLSGVFNPRRRREDVSTEREDPAPAHTPVPTVAGDAFAEGTAGAALDRQQR